jgi:hypothetical protein
LSARVRPARGEPSLAFCANCHPGGTLLYDTDGMNSNLRVNPYADRISFLRDTKSIGELSELLVALALGRLGYYVSKPLGENARYDLVIDKDGKLSRVQVKTGRLRNGTIVFHTYSSHAHRGGSCKPYTNQIEFFGVYCPELHSVYLIPIEDTARLSGTLRVKETKNRQHAQIRWAQPYLVDIVSIPEVVVGAEAVSVVTDRSSRVPS